MIDLLSGPPPAAFNMAAYCLAPGRPRDPDKTGLILAADPDARDAEHLTFAALDLAVRGVAAGLEAAGLRRGERLVIALPNTADYLLLFYGAIAAGIVPLPASSLLTPAEVAFLVADSGAVAVAVAEGAAVPVPPGTRLLGPMDVAAIRAASPRSGYADTGADDPAFFVVAASAPPKAEASTECETYCMRPRPGNGVASEMRAPRVRAWDVPTGSWSR